MSIINNSTTFDAKKSVKNLLLNDFASILQMDQNGVPKNIFNMFSNKKISKKNISKFFGCSLSQLETKIVDNKNCEFRFLINKDGEVIPYFDNGYLKDELKMTPLQFIEEFQNFIIELSSKLPKYKDSILFSDINAEVIDQIYKCIDSFCIPSNVDDLFKELHIGVNINKLMSEIGRASCRERV